MSTGEGGRKGVARIMSARWRRRAANHERNASCWFSFSFQPVGFVTFHTRAGAEAAKQDLQVIALFSQASARQVERKRKKKRTEKNEKRWWTHTLFVVKPRLTRG